VTSLMRDIAAQLHHWRTSGRGFAVATVVAVSGSAPRRPGAALAVTTDGQAVGSVSGGCVEAAVYELCLEALRNGRPVRERFGYSDEDAFAAALTCGGVIDVFVQPAPVGPDLVWDDLLHTVSAQLPVALLRVLQGPNDLLGAALAVHPKGHVGQLPPGRNPRGDLGALQSAALAQARAMLESGATGVFDLAPDGRSCPPTSEEAVTFFVESYGAPARMLIFGAIDFADSLACQGAFLGYRVTVCDAREVFATPARFSHAHEVVVSWPHRYLEEQAAAGLLDARTVVCVLTHDAKFDIPLLERALRMPLGYVGAMGSRRTHADRTARLREAQLTDHEIATLHAPIGLDLGAHTPEETAVAIAAEIIAHRRGGHCLPLTHLSGPIHHAPAGLETPGVSMRPRSAGDASVVAAPAAPALGSGEQ